MKLVFFIKKICILAIFIVLSACSNQNQIKQNLPVRYELYLFNINQDTVIKYIDFISSDANYQSHKLLSMTRDYAELIYTTKATSESIYKNAQSFFGESYQVTVSSNVFKIKKVIE